jgi:hypothetical protein
VRDSGANDADGDFFKPRKRDIEYRGRRIHRGQADNGDGIARQEESIASRRPVLQRREEAEPDPYTDRQRQKDGRLNQGRHQKDRHGCPHQRAGEAINALGANSARNRLGDDEDGEHRPIGAFEIEPERNIQSGQHGHDVGDTVGQLLRPARHQQSSMAKLALPSVPCLRPPISVRSRRHAAGLCAYCCRNSLQRCA